MKHASRIQVSAQVLAATLLLLSSHSVLAQRAGTVEFATGEVSALATNGSVRSLVKHGEVLSGDRIVTRNGRAQIRFADGAFVSLVPDTEFHVRNYRYEGRTDGSEQGFFALMRGTIRAVSGLIGKANRTQFEIQTPTATLGIRGTAGIIDVAADGTTRVTATEGVWELKNGAGTMDVPAGITGVATPNFSLPPRRTQDSATGAPEQPRGEQRGRTRGDGGGGNGREERRDERPISSAGSLVPPPPPGSVAGDSTTSSGTSTSTATSGSTTTGGSTATPPPPPPPLPPPPPPLSYSATATAVFTQGATPYQDVQALNTASTVVSGLPPTVQQITDLSTSTTHAVLGAGTTVLDPGSDGATISWSRWIGTFDANIGGTFQTVTLGANQGYHIVGIAPTPQASLPTSGVANFTFLGGTNPTFSNNTLTPGVFTAGASNPMTIDFATGKVAFAFDVNFTSAQTGGSPLTVSVNTGPVASSPVGLNLDGGGNRLPYFTGSLGGANVNLISSGGPNGSLYCMPSCAAFIQGGIAGATANRVGIVYKIWDTTGAGITGAGAYQRP